MRLICLAISVLFLLSCFTWGAGTELEAATGNDYYLSLNPAETEYELSGKLFEDQALNAYPGLKLPVKKIYITNQYQQAISIQLDMDLVEPDLDWIDVSVEYEQSGIDHSIRLDSVEQKFEEKQIHLAANETILLELHYTLKGEKVLNEHQNQTFRTKWDLVCIVQNDGGMVLPNTGETHFLYQKSLLLLLAGGIFLLLMVQRKYLKWEVE